MKRARKKNTRPKTAAADRHQPTQRQIRAELYKPANIEKAHRLDRGALV